MENRDAEVVGEQEKKKPEMGLEAKNELSNHKKKMHLWVPRFGCMRLDDDFPAVEKPDFNGNHQPPKHLIVMVNGIIGSAQNWRYAAKQFVKAYPTEVIVHCSESNSSMLTLDGVDIMGKRLADEVISVVGRHSNLEKISFVGHSLGGLVARYAIAVLYLQDSTRKPVEENGECGGEDQPKIFSAEEKTTGKIAGLVPMNFITFATPHLGARGHKQIPVLCGIHTLEKAALRASGVLRRTGKHLFMRDNDNDNGKPPLLLQMTEDSDDLKFISALQSFRRRVAYANTNYDHILVSFQPCQCIMHLHVSFFFLFLSYTRLTCYVRTLTLFLDVVGWSSSSLRRLHELPKRRNLVKNAKYRYIFNEETSNMSTEMKASRGRMSEMEEAMMRGLTRLSWERVDVDFRRSLQGLLAHTTIQVKTYCINSHGANVIKHTIDNFQL